jgi:hypothetical protein
MQIRTVSAFNVSEGRKIFQTRPTIQTISLVKCDAAYYGILMTKFWKKTLSPFFLEKIALTTELEQIKEIYLSIYDSTVLCWTLADFSVS